tara:strand:+ start:30 stop:488 length:459 start_codon:yes stop_codon:yes gene_type:complete
MKLLTLFVLLSFITNTYSDCNDDFNNGLSEYNFASQYFESGIQKHKEAVALSLTSNPDFFKICNILVDSVTGFSVAQSSYLNCMLDFHSAITTCSGSDSAEAKQNKEVCRNNEDIADDNLTTLRALLKNTCFSTKSNYQNIIRSSYLEQIDI